MNKNIAFRFCDADDLIGVLKLLSKNDLPTSDISLSRIKLILAVENEQIVGCIGIESYETDGLLRSFAVAADYQKLGLGKQLLLSLFAYSKQIGIKKLHLLTTTAEKYFQGKGFVVSDRQTAPESIRKTTEFSDLCPVSSAYMTFDKLGNIAQFYSKDLQVFKTHDATQSAFWEISGTNVQFTYFEVPPFRVFEKHQHESEQITYVLEGELFFEIEDCVYRLSKGESIVIPPNSMHKVWTENSHAKAVDAWSPINLKI